MTGHFMSIIMLPMGIYNTRSMVMQYRCNICITANILKLKFLYVCRLKDINNLYADIIKRVNLERENNFERIKEKCVLFY